VTWRLPDVDLPLGCEVEGALMVGVGGSDPMDYHALEAIQCMIERRRPPRRYQGLSGQCHRYDDVLLHAGAFFRDFQGDDSWVLRNCQPTLFPGLAIRFRRPSTVNSGLRM